jgi:hypothetical protein
MFVSRLKRAVESCGLDQTKFSCHSLRRGGATFSFECGVSADQIKLRGDWKSNSYQEYLVLSRESCKQTAVAMSFVAAVRASGASR